MPRALLECLRAASQQEVNVTIRSTQRLQWPFRRLGPAAAGCRARRLREYSFPTLVISGVGSLTIILGLVWAGSGRHPRERRQGLDPPAPQSSAPPPGTPLPPRSYFSLHTYRVRETSQTAASTAPLAPPHQSLHMVVVKIRDGWHPSQTTTLSTPAIRRGIIYSLYSPAKCRSACVPFRVLPHHFSLSLPSPYLPKLLFLRANYSHLVAAFMPLPRNSWVTSLTSLFPTAAAARFGSVVPTGPLRLLVSSAH
ncbi:hypothetical protein K438DRAFT_1771270 [Mycena galopus ATCC 62051]|nr:hypothetical protein K438DRAFT_1771270 [Mycena galopus ATCC 62051]